jgi:short-subunit dehydrogenase
VAAPADLPRLAVVTGASAGIGAALSRRLARAGRPVLAVARRHDRLAALAEEARAAGWAPVHPLAGDVSDEETCVRIASAAAELGGAAWLVNNAGFGYHGPFATQDRGRLALLVRLNCEAVVFLTHALLPQLRASGDGIVLNVASVAAFQPTPFMSVYGASKAFVLSFSEGLSEELRGKGVWVGAYCPGPVETEFREVSGGAGKIRRPAVLSADDAAREALDQIARRKVIHVPRALYRFTTAGVRLLPRALARRLSARAQRGVAEEGSPP